MKRFLWLGFVLFLYLICTGCGETFRPIIISNPPVFPNPRATHTVVAINDNAPAPGQPEIAVGSAMVIDVSGDTDVSVANVGLAPVHAVQQSASQVLVVNQSVTGAGTDSITKLGFSSTAIANTTTITLPANSAPSFVAVAPSATTAYVTLPNYSPPSVGVISTLSNDMTQTVAVGNNPVALAVTPNNSKLYVANQGDSTIGGFNIVTLGLSPRVNSPVSTSSAPIWLVARTDNQRVYALESDGVFAELDTTSTSGPDTLTEYPSAFSVPGAATMVYDSNLNRLYIPGGPVMKIIDVSQSPAQVMATITVAKCPRHPQFRAGIRRGGNGIAGRQPGLRGIAAQRCSAQPSQYFGRAGRWHDSNLQLHVD